MKKKFFIAALLAGVVAASCFAGCTNNGNGGEENEGQQQEQQGVAKGEEVTAEEWTAAINASANLQNFSLSQVDNGEITVTGYYNGNDKVPVNIVTKSSDEKNNYLDLSNKVVYGSNNIWTGYISGFADIYSHNEDYTEDWLESLKDCINSYVYDYDDRDDGYTVTAYGVKIGEKYYSADKWTENDEDSEWAVYEADYFSGATLGDALWKFATEENGEEKPLTELYEAFTYADGVYTADLWTYKWYTVSVSFKDGYILNMSFNRVESGEEEKDGLTVTYVVEETIKLYNIGKTASITPSDDALKAVEDYIKENA